MHEASAARGRSERLDLAGAAGAQGTAVVIDVLRAFTTSAVALAGGAAGIVLCTDVDDALRLRADGTVDVVMGEIDGARPPAFDLSNSPVEVAAADVRGRRIAHRTTAGTRGVVAASSARRVLAASFVVASATARAIAGAPPPWCFVVTGRHSDLDGDDDAACADLIEALAAGATPDREPLLERVRRSTAGRRCLDPGAPDFLPADLDAALDIDRYAFAMPVVERAGRPWLLPASRGR